MLSIGLTVHREINRTDNKTEKYFPLCYKKKKRRRKNKLRDKEVYPLDQISTFIEISKKLPDYTGSQNYNAS